MRQRLPLLCLWLLAARLLPAQDSIPFIKAEQIERWKSAGSDTVLVLNFWATWCAPCVEEIPAFERLQANYADRKVRVVLVSTDFKRHVRSKVLPFVRERQLRSQVLFMDEPTPNKWIDLVSPDWTGALPATLLIGRQGKASVFFEKKLDYAELEAALLGILNE